MLAWLRRQGISVAKCTVERLMRTNGWHGARRDRQVRTTMADPAAAWAPDLVKRHFTAGRSNQLWVADFTYVPLASGFGYTAFVIDAYAGLIPGWEGSLSKQAAFVERAIRQAAVFRRQGHPLPGGAIHHFDSVGSQYTAVHFTETLLLEGLTPSVGTIGDALDKRFGGNHHKLVQNRMRPRRLAVPGRAAGQPRRPGGHHRGLGALTGNNTSRLMHRLGGRAPAEAEASYWDSVAAADSESCKR
jgi:putative transposase